MKKIMMMAAVAAAVLTSCSNSELIELSDSSLPTVWYLKTLLPEYRPGPMRVCGLSDLARPIPKSL